MTTNEAVEYLDAAKVMAGIGRLKHAHALALEAARGLKAAAGTAKPSEARQLALDLAGPKPRMAKKSPGRKKAKAKK